MDLNIKIVKTKNSNARLEKQRIRKTFEQFK